MPVQKLQWPRVRVGLAGRSTDTAAGGLRTLIMVNLGLEGKTRDAEIGMVVHGRC